MLAVVHHHEQAPAPHVLEEGLGQVAGGLVAEAQAPGHGRGDEAGVGERGQLDEEDPVGKDALAVARGAQRQPALPHPADSGQREEPCLSEETAHLGQLPLSPDEAAQLGGQSCLQCQPRLIVLRARAASSGGRDHAPRGRRRAEALGAPPPPAHAVATGSAAGRSATANVSSPSRASTRTVSPSVNSPRSSRMASSSCTSFWIVRFSGRAP